MMPPGGTTSPGEQVPGWRVLAESRVGASHRRAHVELQDDRGWLPERGHGDAVAVFVADGHGSMRSFRSALGARFAVQVCRDLCEHLLAFGRGSIDRSLAKSELEERLGRQLVRLWRRRVDSHRKQQPFTDAELEALAAREGDSAVSQVVGDPHLAYGSTVLAAVATDSYMAYWQIGDGDILTVDAQGNPARPLEADSRLFGNATTSLCSHEAWQFYRWGFSGTPAPLILVSTDGLANSYSEDGGFLRVGSDIFERLVREGTDSVAGQIGGWLTRISDSGSGDDISLGLICHEAVLRVLRSRTGQDG